MIVRFQRGNMTETQGGNVTDISNFPFPSSLQNTETRYFVLCNNSFISTSRTKRHEKFDVGFIDY